MSVTLNGVTYDNADFVGSDGLGYLALFPNQIFGDLLAELATQTTTLNTNISNQNTSITTKINGIAAPGYASLTSLAIGTGAKNFVLTQAASITKGEYRVYSSSNANNFMIVRLAADTVSTTTFNVTCDIVGGSGTFANWIIVPLSTPFRYAARTTAVATTIVGTDLGAALTCTGAGGFTVSLTAAATLLTGFYCAVVNASSGVITIDPNAAETIDGVASITLAAGETVQIYGNGTEFRTLSSRVIAHALTGHTVSGLTAGHVLRATAAAAYAFGALLSTDLPSKTRRAERAGNLSLWRMTRYGR